MSTQALVIIPALESPREIEVKFFLVWYMSCELICLIYGEIKASGNTKWFGGFFAEPPDCPPIEDRMGWREPEDLKREKGEERLGNSDSSVYPCPRVVLGGSCLRK